MGEAFYSHRGRRTILLKDHLTYVGRRAKEIILSKHFDDLDGDLLADVAYLTGIGHDFGKYTSFFQERLVTGRNDAKTTHSLISAFFTFFLVRQYLTSTGREDAPYRFLPLMAFFVVKHHHSDLADLETDLHEDTLYNSGFPVLAAQVADILNRKEAIMAEYVEMLKDFSIDISQVFDELSVFKTPVKDFTDVKELLRPNVGRLKYEFIEERKKDILPYLLTQLFYSVLIDSDKKHAGGVVEIKRKTLPEDLVDRYLSAPDFSSDTPLNRIRNEIRQSVIGNITAGQRIFTITAPTGTGKTLTSLSAALKLRKMLSASGTEPRILYSLPFTSIIDQTYKVFDQVLHAIPDYRQGPQEYLLKHHYLADIFYKTKKSGESLDVEDSLALIESWDSEVVVTTFVQLFHTLIGYRNRSLKKFHNIVNSILILDEVQNIPMKYWEAVRKVLLGMARYFNTTVILMTATKPLIFEEGEYTELVSDYEKYFQSPQLNRVELKKESSRTVPKLYENFASRLSARSYLFVFNTINSSLEFLNNIRQRSGYRVFYLSTNIIPKARRERIDQIKKLLSDQKDEKFIVVSTQMIEAGVDIDCDVVYRDLGPMDALIQVAGRCNRNGRLDKGTVYFGTLENPNDHHRLFAQYIYDPGLLTVTESTLEIPSYPVEEKEFLPLINNYFTTAKSKAQVNLQILDSIYNLKYYGEDCQNKFPVSCFRLIEKDYEKFDVFVELDDKAAETWQKFQALQDIENPWERKKRFYGFKKDFYDYVISLPLKYFDEMPEGIYHLSRERVKDGYYLPETGFNRDCILPPENTVFNL